MQLPVTPSMLARHAWGSLELLKAAAAVVLLTLRLWLRLPRGAVLRENAAAADAPEDTDTPEDTTKSTA